MKYLVDVRSSSFLSVAGTRVSPGFEHSASDAGGCRDEWLREGICSHFLKRTDLLIAVLTTVFIFLPEVGVQFMGQWLPGKQ